MQAELHSSSQNSRSAATDVVNTTTSTNAPENISKGRVGCTLDFPVSTAPRSTDPETTATVVSLPQRVHVWLLSPINGKNNRPQPFVLSIVRYENQCTIQKGYYVCMYCGNKKEEIIGRTGFPITSYVLLFYFPSDNCIY